MAAEVSFCHREPFWKGWGHTEPSVPWLDSTWHFSSLLLPKEFRMHCMKKGRSGGGEGLVEVGPGKPLNGDCQGAAAG